MLAIVEVEGLVGNLFCVLIIPEQHFKDIGAGDLAVGPHFRVQSGEFPHIGYQAGVLRRLAVLGRQHPVHQAQLPELRQHVVHRVIHGIKGVYQRRVPVEQNDRRSDQPDDGRVPVWLNTRLGALRRRERPWPGFRRGGGELFRVLTLQQGQKIHQLLKAFHNGGRGVPVTEPAVDALALPARTVVKHACNAGVGGGEHVHIAVAQIPRLGIRRLAQFFQRLEQNLGIRLVLCDIIGADGRIKQIRPTAFVHRFQFTVKKLPVAVGRYRQPDAHGFQCRQIFVGAGLEGFDLAKVLAIAVVIGLMGNKARLPVITENRIEDVRAGYPSLRQNPRVQTPEDPDVAYQPGIVRRAALVLRQQALYQPQIFQLWQHVFHGTEHGIMGVHQGAVPVKDDHRRWPQTLTQRHHTGTPQGLPGPILPGAAGSSCLSVKPKPLQCSKSDGSVFAAASSAGGMLLCSNREGSPITLIKSGQTSGRHS